MYEKEIQELNKEIKAKKNKIDKVNGDIKIKYTIITVLMIASAILGLGIGSLISHPVLFPIMCISIASMGAIQIYEKGIKGDQNIIDTAKQKIEKYKDDIERYERAQNKTLDMEVKKENKESYSYNYDRDKSSPSEDEFESMIDFFKNPEENEDNHRNKR